MEIEKLRQMHRRGEELTDEEFSLLNQWWKNQIENPNSPTETEIFTPEQFGIEVPKKKEIGAIKCFRCGKPLWETTATFGVFTSISYKEEFDFETCELTRTPIFMSKSVAACDDHCLLIKPGKGKNHSLRFQNFDQ